MPTRFNAGDTVFLGDGTECVVIGRGVSSDYLVQFVDTGKRNFHVAEDLYRLSLSERVARIEEHLGLTK